MNIILRTFVGKSIVGEQSLSLPTGYPLLLLAPGQEFCVYCLKYYYYVCVRRKRGFRGLPLVVVVGRKVLCAVWEIFHGLKLKKWSLQVTCGILIGNRNTNEVCFPEHNCGFYNETMYGSGLLQPWSIPTKLFSFRTEIRIKLRIARFSLNLNLIVTSIQAV